MRPLSLTMTAFGPFPGQETIDFTQLGENPLFLINGPTGSGKTTILDAICFALYGKTTGDEREGAQMRSDLAATDTLTEVGFEFELAGRRFRIRRSPEQQRPKARGEGFTTQAPEAEFKELLAGGGEQLIVASKVSEATREIEELTGLSVDQFRQVMVLPQGQFRQLLMADSNEREKIFGQLFQTRIYRRLEESLKARAAEIRRERERQLQLQQGMLEGANLESAEELETELIELELGEKAARDIKAVNEGAFLAADKACEQGKVLLAEFARLEATTSALTRHEAEKARIDGERQQLRLAEQAGKLQPLFQERSRCETELNQARKTLEAATARQQNAEQTLAEAARNQAGTTALQTDLDRAKQQAAQLDGYRVRAENLARARQARQQAWAGAERTELLLRFRLLIEQQTRQQELARLDQEVDRQQKTLETQKTRGTQLRERFETLEVQAKELELAWHQGQAAILAAELQAGAPCPVCGSREHPSPAHSEQPLPTQQQVEQARQALHQANEELVQAREKFAEEQHRLRELQQQLEERRAAPGGVNEDVGPALAELRRTAHERRQELPTADRMQDADALRLEVTEAKSAAAGAQAQVQAAEQELPEVYREAGALQQAGEEVRRQIKQLEQQILQLATAHQQAQNEMTAASTTLQSARDQQQKTAAARQRAWASFQAALQDSPFGNEEAFLAALLDEDRSEALKTRIAEFDAAGQRLSGALQQLQEQLRDKQRPELEGLEERRRNAETAKNQAVDSWRQLDKRLSLLLETRKKLRKAAADREELDRKYVVVGTLSDVANGQTGNKISLQRFVLSVLLDDVLIEASQRLSLMSKGRYQLLRKEDRAKGNKASGLELEVEDAYTGKLRPVATLSGGESFMAALSLALGLSDVVQAYAGGIRLDTLFIDEGFGSLDAESLDLAIRTLIDLQSAGRMVGIISHVAELKEQLARRIDVLAGRAGSSIRVVTP
jgi:DNA repair protein SbcC/Rad50